VRAAPPTRLHALTSPLGGRVDLPSCSSAVSARPRGSSPGPRSHQAPWLLAAAVGLAVASPWARAASQGRTPAASVTSLGKARHTGRQAKGGKREREKQGEGIRVLAPSGLLPGWKFFFRNLRPEAEPGLHSTPALHSHDQAGPHHGHPGPATPHSARPGPGSFCCQSGASIGSTALSPAHLTKGIQQLLVAVDDECNRM